MTTPTKTVALILAGGRGSRLSPLTDDRPKPAVRFGAGHRIIDCVLNNLANSGIRDIWLVEQYLPDPLNAHLAQGRPWDLDGTFTGLRILPPEQAETPEDGFSTGNGHALFQQLPDLEKAGVKEVVVASADHIFSLDYGKVLETHRRQAAALTMVATVLDQDVSRYGVVETDGDLVTNYVYKPESPATNRIATEDFVFDVAALREAIDAEADRADGEDLGDYGETIVPWLVENKQVAHYELEGYWRDIGTLQAYFSAHMDLLDERGPDLNSKSWPWRTNQQAQAAYVGPSARVTNSLVGPGASVRGEVTRSVIGPDVVVEPGATVSNSIVSGATTVPAGAHLESVIVAEGAAVPAERIGETKPGPGNLTILSGDGTRDVE
ncbi:ADP-glucose pyrophosphorylase [Corynebacterium renale]|uniref:glucose-1-phosphate adenylyltransferase family protein n=1 Tax=Corynebacterium renale TaxID=1724 RepID=UPI000DA30798|nr:sugar phosphate nucleotidyltransferase [Corynebacterium renale]SQG63348.1 ADP-glucose pyrophosphorylase [Corynebacterium renale]STC99654.1 ADP-glucose pyrophosphorylase [Corynebacterium renale]